MQPLVMPRMHTVFPHEFANSCYVIVPGVTGCTRSSFTPGALRAAYSAHSEAIVSFKYQVHLHFVLERCALLADTGDCRAAAVKESLALKAQSIGYNIQCRNRGSARSGTRVSLS